MPGRPIRTFTVLPHLPERLRALSTLAYNLWWCWNHEAVALFRRINPDLFESLDSSPIRLLSATTQVRYNELLTDDGFLAHMDRVEAQLKHYIEAPTWFEEAHPDRADCQVAYFSAEFGIHESVPEYSGGLGVLAGDHLKSASDLGIPLSGVTLMYRQGYLRQYLNVDGWQQERYPENDFFNLPLIQETGKDGKPLVVTVPFPGRTVHLKVWRVQVGRVPLYLLDANIPENSADDRNVTAQLYGGDQDTRVRQEMMLGIGGLRALRALGKTPTVCHLNEGHAAFVALERIRIMMEENGTDFDTAAEAVRAGTCFTTHTPVPAGNDAFPAHLINHYFTDDYLKQLGIDRRKFWSIGRQHPADEGEPFGMTVLALKLSNVSNGVSMLHGSVSRKMWKSIWPGLPDGEVPITSITNGVHTQSWISEGLSHLFDRYLGVQWEERPTDYAVWKRVEQIPDAELWRTHERSRERLVAVARHRLSDQLKKRGSPQHLIAAADEVLDPDALTIGFARRFATYKRGNLVFRDLARLDKIINDKDRPVQFIFAGKSHPKDTGGKELIAQVVQMARRAEFRRRVVFLEDYDMAIARLMVQGVDVWMNNPRRPLEASGTSGMKAAANGGLNFSVLDGWWVEGYLGDNGWAIGHGEEYTDLNYQDEVESRSIYDLLEQEVVPAFYTRGSDGLPRQWLRRMKRCISTLVPVFNTNRMVQEYVEKCYLPSDARFETLAADGTKPAGELAKWKKRLQQSWGQIKVESVESTGQEPLRVGGELGVSVKVSLGHFTPADVSVQLYHGVIDSFGEIAEPRTVELSPLGGGVGSNGHNTVTYRGTIPCAASGQYGFNVRVLPKHPHMENLFEPALVTWGA